MGVIMSDQKTFCFPLTTDVAIANSNFVSLPLAIAGRLDFILFGCRFAVIEEVFQYTPFLTKALFVSGNAFIIEKC
jgi:hypothetical protein